jgi:hypothetical protein
MAPLDTPPQTWHARLLAELTRDKKKTALLSGLLLLAAILGVRMLVQGSGPSTAGAEPAVVAKGGGAMPAVTQAGAPTAALAAANAGKSTPFAGGDLRPVRGHPKIEQDIFAPKLHLFPLEQEAKPVAAPAPVPVAQPVDQAKVHQEAILAKAKGLSLQSTIVSSQPKAIINGQLVGAGDLVDGFKVVQVTAHACVVVRDGVQVTLEMKDQ